MTAGCALKPVEKESDIPREYRDNPVGSLLRYHNLAVRLEACDATELLVLMCMDGRQELRLPRNFSFIVRNSGGRLKGASFAVSFAIAVGGVRHIAVIGHSDCRMDGLRSRKEEFVRGLSAGAGWERAEAERHFEKMCGDFVKEDALSSVLSEAGLIGSIYRGVVVAPLYYSTEDGRLYLVEERA